MGWLDSFLHPEKGYKKGQQQLDKYYQESQGFQQPYFNQGQGAYGNLSEAMQALLNPEELQNKWVSGYKESEAAKNAERMAQEHGLSSASAQGLLGSTPALNAIQQGTSQIALNDRNNYLDNLMKKYLAGAGIASNIYGTGANAANNLSNNANNMGTNSANLAYGAENAQGDLLSKLLGGGIGLFGGGIGNALGGGLSQAMGWSPKGSYTPWSMGGH